MVPLNKPLDIEWLRDFVVLAESGNFSRAAKERAVAQPALSRHIRSLEEWVGLDLFDRSTHPSSLTEAGKHFRVPVEDLLERLELARRKARAGHDRAAGVLRFAATHALSLAFFPNWLSGMEAVLRIGPIQMISDNFWSCEDLMLQQQVQFLLCHGHDDVKTRVNEATYPYHVLGADLLVPVSAPTPEGQARYTLGGTRQDAVPVLLYSRQSGLGHIMRSMMKGTLDEDSLNIVFTSHHAVLLKTMILEGRGVAWLPRSLVEGELRAGTLVDAGGDGWNIPLEIRLFRQPAQLAGPAEALWNAAVAAGP
jgi:DNA-binding transcriptional LysR family regulator